jgi:hypothetical protein
VEAAWAARGAHVAGGQVRGSGLWV